MTTLLTDHILTSQDYYHLLKVSPSAPTPLLRKAYRQMALRLHPDKHSSPQATTAFKKLTKAYKCLSDQSQRALYDQYRADPHTKCNFYKYRQEQIKREQRHQQLYQQNFNKHEFYIFIYLSMVFLVAAILPWLSHLPIFSGPSQYTNLSLRYSQEFNETIETPLKQIYFIRKGQELSAELHREADLKWLQVRAKRCTNDNKKDVCEASRRYNDTVAKYYGIVLK